VKNTLVDIIADPERVAEISKSEIIILLGELECLRAQLWCRLTEPVALLGQTERQECDRLLTVDEAASKLAFKPAYLYELIRQRIFPAVRQGKYVRIRVCDLTAWIDRHRENGFDT
jgi:excisionase family DNA binding protein